MSIVKRLVKGCELKRIQTLALYLALYKSLDYFSTTAPPFGEVEQREGEPV